MACPVCGGTEFAEVNVRVRQESDLKQVVGSTWSGRNVARCDECGVLYDHRYAASGDSEDGDEGNRRGPDKVNCPDCGSRNPGDQDRCSYCGSSLA